MKTVLAVIALCVSVVGQAAYSGSGYYSGAVAYSVSSGSGSTINAASCSSGDVQTAINAAANGDIVIVPAGNCTYSTALTSPVGITLKGAGEGSTNITLSGSDFIRFQYTITGGAVRVTGFTLTGTNSFGAIQVDGAPTSARLDHLTSTNLSHRFAIIGSNTTGRLPCHNIYGLADHITFAASTQIPAFLIYGCTDNWSNATTLGTANAFYVEDSSFSWTTSGWSGSGIPTDCEFGCQFVFRHNTISKSYVSWHDTGSTQQSRGTRSFEVYSNTFSCVVTDASCYVAMTLRGGTGVVYDNSFPMDVSANNGYSNSGPISTEIYRASHSGGGDPWTYAPGAETFKICWFQSGSIRSNCSTSHTACGETEVVGAACAAPGTGTCQDACTTDADCGGAPNKCLSRFDGAASGYPARDQIGTSKDGTDSANTQGLDPAYVWNNTNPNNSNAPIATAVVVSGSDTTYIQTNREFYQQGSSFTGATGVGRGTLASRPSTCTAGVGYWETDGLRLDKCIATNTWTNGVYTPYAYPHPLQSSN